ncbi:uncharacterized protein LOC129322417 [Prosopis cineraria]|uniref:uncharacterized protein LOC129322417 n=1 Tax=Prosopis cineraria TaxID=364024 RepID=UPI00240F77BD|nr:uncharacterized protein LOC129322417 [Prosopis cineraria]
MEVQPNDVNEFTVVHGKSSFIVYLETRSCSCRKWDFEEIPCSHTCAVISKQRLCAYTFVSRYYTKYSYGCTYGATIHSLGNQCDWAIPSEVLENNLMPPEIRRGADRPKKTRIPSVGEFKRTVRCSRCEQFGHNRATCKNHIPIGINIPKKQKTIVGSTSQI